MAYNTTAIKTDVNGKPIPQYFDPLADEYKPLLGQHGAARSILYGPDGQPIGTSGNPLQVKAHDTDTVLGQIKDALNIAVEDLKSELANIKANQLSGDQKVQLSGNIGSKQVIVRKINPNFTHELGRETIYETSKPVIIDQFTWVVSGLNASIGFQIRIPLKGEFFNLIQVGGTSFQFNTPQKILNEIAPQWEVIRADAVNNVYAFSLRNTPLAFPEGITLQADYASADVGPLYYAAFVLGREML